MPHVVQQGGRDECRRVGLVDGCHEALVLPEATEELERQPVDPEGVFEPVMPRPGIDERHEPQLADPGESAHLRGVEQQSHPRSERNGEVGRDADTVDDRVEGDEFRQRGESHRTVLLHPLTAAARRPASGGTR